MTEMSMRNSTAAARIPRASVRFLRMMGESIRQSGGRSISLSSRKRRLTMKRTYVAIIGIAAFLFCASAAFAQIPLGTAQGFAALAGSTITNTGSTVVHGNIGVSPGSSVTGFPPGIVTAGSIHAGDAVAAQAQSDLTTAYNTAAGLPCTTDLSGQNLGGLTLTPGVYCFTSSAALTGPRTLH